MSLIVTEKHATQNVINYFTRHYSGFKLIKRLQKKEKLTLILGAVVYAAPCLFVKAPNFKDLSKLNDS